MKTILKILMMFSLLATTSLVSAEIYKWVDEKGTIHFTEDPATIPPKYMDKTKSRTTEEDHMTVEQRIRIKEGQERRAKETIEKNRQEFQMSLQEENRRTSEREQRELKDTVEEVKAEQARQKKQVRKLEEGAQGEERAVKEDDDSYKKCYNCDGRGYIIGAGRKFYGSKPCSICGGSGRVKK